MTFKEILTKYRQTSFSERNKGDRFERLIQAYLLTDPMYSQQFESVWMWDEFSGRQDLGGKDTGIDLVAKTNEGDYWAIQCKCFQEDAVIDKKAVDTFLSTSSREFLNDEGKKVGFGHRLWIDTTKKGWGPNAEEAIKNQKPAVSRIGLSKLSEAPVDWQKLQAGLTGQKARTEKKSLRPHQTEALKKTHEHFKKADRGKLIMACGTGKTFTSLRIAENETSENGTVLFLVPSIALLGQTLREWTADANERINPICVCSDSEITRDKKKKVDSDGYIVEDLALPASTNFENVIEQFRSVKDIKKTGKTIFFSTYQSIEVISKAQKQLIKDYGDKAVFDLIVCDEAHRTTGVALTKSDSSEFIKVHDNDFLKAKKRLYMTATPRLYNDDSKSKAAKNDAILCSMDDPKVYGDEIYRIGFGEAVEKDLLTDYKVLILTLSEQDVPLAVQKAVSNQDGEVQADDASKLVGCVNALSKQILGDAGLIKATDPEPMKKAVAFCRKITESQAITGVFNDVTDVYLDTLKEKKRKEMQNVASKHIDGSMSATKRDELMTWLKEDSDECRILTNVRCLSEGVDVPSLDAVMFLSARSSQVDVVQSVGRVMRKSPNKKYGYIIIPVVVPSDVAPDKALDDNERYKVVWSVLNALRAHDDRFNATVNKIELNNKRPENILVGGVGGDGDDGDDLKKGQQNEEASKQMSLQFQELQSVMYAKMVQKVGDRRYWEQWASSIAVIAQKNIDRMKRLMKEDQRHKKAFKEFLKGLQKNINPSITEQQAIEMLSQHIITKPVFEALFEGYSFVKSNAISVSMQKMLDLLEADAIDKDTEVLEKFYESVKKRAEGIDNAEGKQKIIIELYDKFFKTAFPKMVEQLGIVYTPVEVVDFIIHSVNDVLKKEFSRSLSDENIHILDPFTGTGTFMTRLLQSGLIEKKDLHRKYAKELHANEIVLLAYYIAAVNIENAYHDLSGDKDYKSFEGICLTDTFQLGETDEGERLFSDMFPQNSERVEAQKKAPIRVIMGNPPYSIGQKSANDNAQNQEYPKLNKQIEETYAKDSKATSVKALYDPYIKAFRWSTDRLGKQGGLICFVSNGAWIDRGGMDKFRKCLEEEFSSIYVFNLRGNQRTSGELSKKEGGKIFGSGSRTPISITLLVKNPKNNNEKAKIQYYDIGDYLSRKEKLEIISKFSTVSNSTLNWKTLKPNEHGDWINQRNDVFDTFIPIQPEKKFEQNSKSYFLVNSLGINTNRDSWIYNSSQEKTKRNIERMIDFYNQQVDDFKIIKKNKPNVTIKEFICTDSKKISWSSSLFPHLKGGRETTFEPSKIVKALYRPFFKQNLYIGEKMIHRRGQQKELFPADNMKNLVISMTGVGSSKEYSCLISNVIADIQVQMNNQIFPLYYYEEKKESSLFDKITGKDKYIRRDGVSDFIINKAQKIYGKEVTKEDIFYYVYGFLHSPDYRKAFANDLKKMLPRLPLVDNIQDFWQFSKAGRKLAELHINYEKIEPYPDVKVEGESSNYFHVEKMRFPKKDQKDTIIYNSKITISNIPEKAYHYVVNGKSAIEWIMDRYQIKTDKKSGITNDPNDWAKEVDNPKYILDLLLSVINVSVQSVEVVEGLPKVKF